MSESTLPKVPSTWTWPHKIRDYQKENVKFLLSRGGAIIADDPGLGKTISILVTVALMNPSPPLILLVCPKNAVYTWRNAIKEWLNHPNVELRNPVRIGIDRKGQYLDFIH